MWMTERAAPSDDQKELAIGTPAGAATASNLAAPTLGAFLDELARQIAARVVDQLRATDLPGYVDQSVSPLGRRRHIAAIRSGNLPGVRIGRRYLARQDDVERFMATDGKRSRAVATTPEHDLDALAAELGFRKRR
jgi:hypothetical protein